MEIKPEKIVRTFIEDTKQILKDNLVAGYLFGSHARNEQKEFSDIDILIIVKNFNPKIREQLSSLSSDYSLKWNYIISPIIKDVNIWQKNKRFNTLFYSEIQKDGIKLC